jgi:hypothetical protein
VILPTDLYFSPTICGSDRSGRVCFVALGSVFALRGYDETDGLLDPSADGQRIRLRRPRSQALHSQPHLSLRDESW